MKIHTYSRQISIFHGRKAAERGTLVGYGAIIESLLLPMPFPNRLSIISEKRRSYETDEWLVFSSKNTLEDTIDKQLIFALKYEGINLLFFKKLFECLSKEEVTDIVLTAYSGQYMRKIWFLYEWLMQEDLPIPDLNLKNYITLIDDALQYASPVSIDSKRHRIKNNLPGTREFCPLIYKTAKIEHYIAENLSEKTSAVINGVHKDILLRTSAFLLLKDSKASFTIEGENPQQNRAAGWGRAIGQAGMRPLDKDELLRLQQIVIGNNRFVKMGYRTEGGFIGEHDRSTGEPIPEHISARWQDLEELMNGLLGATNQMINHSFYPILAAAKIAFGFVFIHPFVDGNGRLHRYLMHHLLAAMKFTPQGIIFPVSYAIWERMIDYGKVLKTFSHPLLDFIEWEKTNNNNINVLGSTIDYYRYWDATRQAEFLFECVDYTITKIIPDEVSYLQKYDEMKNWLDDHFQMPDNMVALLIRFLEQNGGKLSKRAKEREFSKLTEDEATEIQKHFQLFFEKE